MSTAGYSGTPLPRKLGIKAGHRVALVAAPAAFADLLEPLPEGVRLIGRQPRAAVDVIVAFCLRRADLERLPRLLECLRADGGLWLGWPKKSSGVPTELDFDVVQGAGLATGLVDNKICALDQTWSGLRFVVRRENRAQWPVR